MPPTRLLIVEDERIVAADIRQRLQKLGYEVPAIEAYGDRAVELAGELRPDLVLMDIFIKGSMDGIAAAEQIGAKYDIPVIFLTAYADAGTIGRAKMAGPFGYVLKPFEERELQTVIEMALFKHQMERQLRISNRHLAVVVDITTAINQAEGTQDLLDHVLHGLLDLAETGSGAIYIREEGSTDLRLRAAVVQSGGRGARFRELVSIPAAAEQCQIAESPGAHFLQGSDGPAGMTVVPICVKDRSIGAIALATKLESTDGGRELLSIGSQLGIALENARLFRKVQDTSSYLASIIQESPDAMLTTDPQGRIVSFNRSASRLLGYAADEIAGRPLAQLLPAGESLELAEGRGLVRTFRARDGALVRLNIATSKLYRDGAPGGFIVSLKDLSEIVPVVPVTEGAADTRAVYALEPGVIYLLDRHKRPDYLDVFADQVKHNIQGLCVTRQNPKKIREQYGLEKTPILWLNSAEVPGENVIKPDQMSSLAATLYQFLAEAQDGLILLDGMEYLMMRSSFETLLKFTHYLNDHVMRSRSRALFCIDAETIEKRQLHMLMSEMADFERLKPFFADASAQKSRLPE